jgi:chemotaxis receptor (MCP) glutamine deamidase CheD
MLVNSCPFHYTGIDDAIAALEGLPTAFSARTKVSTPFRYASFRAFLLNKAGMAAYNAGHDPVDTEKLGLACMKFNKAAQRSARKKDSPAQAYDLFNYGRAASLMGDYAGAIDALEKASEMNLQADRLDCFYDDIGALYDALQNLSKQPQSNTEELRQKIAAAQEQALWARENCRHESVNPDAYRVEQAEIGFSDKAPIGTDNVRDCVCVMVRDPVTHKTGLAHIDYSTGIYSLQRLFDRMPADSRLEVRLVGACYGKDKELSDTSIENMQKVTNFLSGKNVDILSTDIYDENQPRAVVVNPETFAITEQRPGKENPDKRLGNGMPFISFPGKSLHVAFDLTRSPERAPHLLTENEVSCIGNESHRVPQRIYEGFKQNWGIGNFTEAAARTEFIRICVKAHQDAVKYLVEIVDQQIAGREERGIKVLPGYREEIIDALERIQLHIGTSADNFNRPLEDFIKTGLFRSGPDSETCDIDISGLRAVELDTVPYEKIERAAGVKPPEVKRTARTLQSVIAARCHKKP